MKNKLNTLSVATIAVALSLAGCSSTPVEDNTTSIDNTEVAEAVPATPVEETPMATKMPSPNQEIVFCFLRFRLAASAFRL